MLPVLKGKHDANPNIPQTLELSDTNLKACIIAIFYMIKENAFEINGKKTKTINPQVYILQNYSLGMKTKSRDSQMKEK